MEHDTKLLYLTLLACLTYGSNQQSPSPPTTNCGDWIPFKDEKCIKLVDKAALQTKEDADIICRSYADEFPGEGPPPKLVTAQTEEKQRFLQKLLFQDLEVLDNVWLGIDLGKDNTSLQWNDGTDLFYTNWAQEETMKAYADRERNCVHMESGENIFPAGKWVRDVCQKRNAVVCERIQPLNLLALQNFVLSLKLEVEKNKLEAAKKLNQELRNLKETIFPVGYIYVQLPGQRSPEELHLGGVWTIVSSSYSGLFFRVEGSGANAFDGSVQSDNTRHVKSMGNGYNAADTWYDIPTNGDYSGLMWSGGDSGSKLGIMLSLTTGEVRPRNKSVRIWLRIA